VKLNRDMIRAIVWLAITTFIAIAAFAENAHAPRSDKLTFFDWTIPASAFGEAILFGVPALLLARGDWELLGFRRPRRLGLAVGLAVVAILGTNVLGGIMSHFGNLEKEQGLTPDHWIHGHTAPFIASLLAVGVAVPIIEETFFRGVGLGLFLRIYSPAGAIVLCGCMFGLVHGLVLGFLPLAFLGGMLALMRYKTGSTIPGIVLHGAYNTLAVLSTLFHWF
jgi:membrane protease YdiL (CAAX protease family)